jgi:antitoxin (DNA-binding transcriptional repressor) of toxin-antitoxin stability system
MAKLKRVAMAEARASLADLADEIRRRGQRVKLTRYGRTVLWLVPPEDGKLLDECASHLEQCRKLRSRPAKAPAKTTGKASG